jgi:hypothetical protein
MCNYHYYGAHQVMTEKKKSKKTSTKKGSSKQQKHKSDLVVAKSDDLREIVTETVTKLLAEDVLEMDEDGTIDIKQPGLEEVKKKKKKKDD